MPSKLPPLREAELIYRTVVDTTDNDTRRCEVLKSLCSLYQNGFHDIDRLLQTVKQLPTMRYTRKSVKAQVIEGEAGVAYTQDYLERLTDTLGAAICAYVINTVDNAPQMWEWKAEALIWIIGMYGQVFGENLLFYHGRVAYLWRVVATYRGHRDGTMKHWTALRPCAAI